MMVEQFLILICGHKRVVSNVSTRISGLCNGCDMIVEAGFIFDELHDGSVRVVSIIMWHCFCTEAMERIFARDFGLYHMLPKFLRSPIWDETWGTAVRVHLEDMSTLLDVGKEMTVAENVDRLLSRTQCDSIRLYLDWAKVN